MAAPATVTKAAVAGPVHRSFLRGLCPVRYRGNGVATTVIRESFFRHEFLIPRTLRMLEMAPLPALPRMMFAEGFQMLLDRSVQIRDVRGMFEDSSLEIRRWLNQETSDAMNPMLRLLGYELLAAASYYEAILSISPQPQEIATLAARNVVSSDLKSDRILVTAMTFFETLERDPVTGDRPRSDLDILATEMVLLERDAFGKHRFDIRGVKRHVLHCIDLSHVGVSDASFSLLKDPVLTDHGNFKIESKVLHARRWMEHRVSCGDEDTRVDTTLPDIERVTVKGDGWESEVFLQYNLPICDRMLVTSTPSSKGKPQGGNESHVEVIELAIPDNDKTFFEKWFQY